MIDYITAIQRRTRKRRIKEKSQGEKLIGYFLVMKLEGR
jgi:hypothetical protein